MGSACTKSNEQQVMLPQNQLEFAINNEFTPFLRLDHPFNVNHKYEAMFTFNKNEFAGQGIKRTHSYVTKYNKKELLQKRKEFWETRVEGQTQTWQILKQAVETDEKNALAILAAGGIKLVNRSLQIAYDETGHKYDIPIFCLNDPVYFDEKPSYEIALKSDFEQKSLNILIRCQKIGTDTKIKVENSKLISELKSQFLSELKQPYNLRMFYNGRELMNDHKIGEYNIEDDSLISAFALQKQVETNTNIQN